MRFIFQLVLALVLCQIAIAIIMWILICSILFLKLITYRAYCVFSSFGKGLELKNGNARVLAIAGSGGHTSELLRLLGVLSASRYSPRYYVIADTDVMSTTKIQQFEKGRVSNLHTDYFIIYIPRSREVAQPWLSSIWTTFVATLHSFPILWKCKPDLILCNGPGTCIPLCFVGFLFRFLGLGRSQIVFVESICRVKSLSMSGSILYYFADKVFVQWPDLKLKYPRAEYFGRIV